MFTVPIAGYLAPMAFDLRCLQHIDYRASFETNSHDEFFRDYGSQSTASPPPPLPPPLPNFRNYMM
jgi:hypothetical protein